MTIVAGLAIPIFHNFLPSEFEVHSALLDPMEWILFRGRKALLEDITGSVDLGLGFLHLFLIALAREKLGLASSIQDKKEDIDKCQMSGQVH